MINSNQIGEYSALRIVGTHTAAVNIPTGTESKVPSLEDCYKSLYI